jgi:hypothetical protein
MVCRPSTTAGCATYDPVVVARTWILQASPKRYDIDAALQARPVIYWRVPQFFGQMKAGDRVLLWRSGKEAGIVGSGVLLSEPAHYDLSGDDDSFVRDALPRDTSEWYVPVRVWPESRLPKTDFADAIPQHNIVTAPRFTVYKLDADDFAALRPLLDARGYDLVRPATGEVPQLLPIVPDVDVKAAKQRKETAGPRAQITPALFLLSSTPETPIELMIEGESLRMALAEREAVKGLDESWDSVGVYLLIGAPTSEGAVLSIYVGRAGAVRSRVRTGHDLKAWDRCLLIQRPGIFPFNAADIAWLERRLIDVLLEAPNVDLINKTQPPPEFVPDFREEMLERTVVAALGVLGVLGAHIS